MTEAQKQELRRGVLVLLDTCASLSRICEWAEVEVRSRYNLNISPEKVEILVKGIIHSIAETMVDPSNKNLHLAMTFARYAAIYKAAIDSGKLDVALRAAQTIAEYHGLKPKAEPSEPKGPASRGRMPSVAVQINNTLPDHSGTTVDVTQMSDEELAAAIGEDPNTICIEQHVPPKIISLEEATQLLEAQTLSDNR